MKFGVDISNNRSRSRPKLKRMRELAEMAQKSQATVTPSSAVTSEADVLQPNNKILNLAPNCSKLFSDKFYYIILSSCIKYLYKLLEDMP